MPWNLKSTYFSLKIIHFLSLNIWYVIYVVFWIKYWNLKLPHHCILFLFTICSVSQLFWNRVCRCRVCFFITLHYMYCEHYITHHWILCIESGEEYAQIKHCLKQFFFLKDLFLAFLHLFDRTVVRQEAKLEREGDRIGKGPRAGTRTRKARSAPALQVNALPTRLSAPTVQNSSKQIFWWILMWQDNRGWTLSPEEVLLWIIDWYFGWCFKVKKPFHFNRPWTGIVRIWCLDSYSDGTHSLQRIQWWANDIMQNFINLFWWKTNFFKMLKITFPIPTECVYSKSFVSPWKV